jgi:acetyl esterase/lipase
MNLWPGDPPAIVPGAGPGADDGTGRYRNVGIPGMLVYLPQPGGVRRTAMIVCPGGAYTHLTRLVGGDGTVAEFCPKGVVIIALKYRLNPPSKHVEADSLADLKRAVRLVRAHAVEWKIDPNKVGVLGWSAGANLALNLATHFDRGDPASTDPVEKQSCRPDYIVLLSPWPDGQTLAAYPIGKHMPPAFIGSAKDDKTAPTAFAQGIEDTCQNMNVNAEMILLETGGHDAIEPTATGPGSKWQDRFWPWLVSIGMAND